MDHSTSWETQAICLRESREAMERRCCLKRSKERAVATDLIELIGSWRGFNNRVRNALVYELGRWRHSFQLFPGCRQRHRLTDPVHDTPTFFKLLRCVRFL